MNKRGISILFTMMLGVVIMILAISLAGPLRASIDQARNVTIDDGNSTASFYPDVNVTQRGLDCLTATGATNDTISDFQSAACFATDMMMPLFILALIGIGGAIIGARLLLG